MSPATVRFVQCASLAVGLTGAVLGWQRYVFDPGPEPLDPALALDWSGVHPWQDEVRAAHLVVAPGLVFAIGLLWAHHVWPRVRSGIRARRRSGLALAALAAPMVLSGVFLQVAVHPTWRLGWMWAHGVTGGLWCLACARHLVRPSATH